MRGHILRKLVRQDTGYSTRAVLVLAAVALGTILLGILIAGLIVDLCVNKTFTVSLSDAALFVGSITSLWTGVGFAKAMDHRQKFEYPKREKPDASGPGEIPDEEV